MAKVPLNVFAIFWLFLAMRPIASTTEGTTKFGITIAYTTTQTECSGSRPTVKLSTRRRLVGVNPWNLAWVYTGNCSSYQEINLEQVSFYFSRNNPRYQFGIELTTASSCHCVTILINATGTFGTNLFGDTNHLWCNKSINGLGAEVQCFNQLCASETKSIIFGSRILTDDGTFIYPPAGMIPKSLPSSGNYNTGVCLELSNTLHTTMFESASLVAFLSSSSSSHTTVEDHKPIMATPTSYFSSLSSTYPTFPTLASSYSTTPTPELSTSNFLLEENSMATLISYSLPTTITNKLSQFTTELMKLHTLPYSSPIPTPTLIYVLHTNGGVSQIFARSSLTAPGASPSPTMLFCSESKDGKWPKTPACANATSTDCGNKCSRHANDTRTCHCNGTWGSVHCIVDMLTKVQELIDASPVDGLMRLVRERSINNTQRLRLLRRAFTVQSNIHRASLQVFDTLHPISNDETKATANVAFLPLLDKIALSLRRNISINTTNIILIVQEVLPDTDQLQVTLTNDSYISLPEEIFRNSDEPVTIVSFFFKNISHLLPEKKRPISPIISSTLNCTNCRTSDLSENVTISFSLPPKMKNDKECVFADLQRENISDIWSNSGCVVVKYGNGSVKYENGSVICSCNHLTHFAILLSPGVEMSEQHTKALTVIGQVLISISLFFLLATIFTYVLHKSLWNMRNYIHVMLCANLFTSQLLFVVGVERTENTAVCSAIAVLLHYMFLVVFMWMLMEGVVLYVALVVVFVNHCMRYIAGFTIASYGIPLVYMGVVVPIGFLVNTDDNRTHYGQYNTSGELIACWLRYDTHFIWAFIVPVVLIILINLGLLIRALVVMCKHFRRQKDKSELDTSKHWLKVIVSLTVVMGIAWVGNILYFNINLLFIAYIMTAIIAGQGIIIFILFVPLSKQVRDAYSNLWRVKQAQSEILSKMFPTKGTNLPTSAISTNKSSNGNGSKHEDNIVMGTFSSEKAESNGSNIYEECEYNKCLVSTHDEIQEKSPKAD